MKKDAKAPGPRRDGQDRFPWARLPEEEILKLAIKDLGLRAEGSWVREYEVLVPFDYAGCSRKAGL